MGRRGGEAGGGGGGRGRERGGSGRGRGEGEEWGRGVSRGNAAHMQEGGRPERAEGGMGGELLREFAGVLSRY